jgi:hypothetical protein
MSEVSTGFKTRLEYVLDQICINARHGGSHEMRRFVAEKLMAAAEAGDRSLDRLAEVARFALASFVDESSAGSSTPPSTPRRTSSKQASVQPEDIGDGP